MQIIPLLLGHFHVDSNGEFSILSSSSPSSGLRMAVQPFLIRTKLDLILIDLRVQLQDSSQSLLLQAFETQGIDPSEVTKVLLSHLHKDHVMGLGHFAHGEFEMHFKKADIYVSRGDLENALQSKDSTSYILPLLEALKESDQVRFLEEPKGWITKEIYYEISGGHTQYHQEFWIVSSSQIVFYGGDNLPQYSYWRRKVAYKSDYDGKTASELREKWKTQAYEKNWTVLFYHDLKKPVVSL
ncbi:MBL fold metallo-hydrolase [Chryseobacterium sp. A301]